MNSHSAPESDSEQISERADRNELPDLVGIQAWESYFFTLRTANEDSFFIMTLPFPIPTFSRRLRFISTQSLWTQR